MGKLDLRIAETSGSTNTELKQTGKAGAPEGTALLAKKQTGGRGRMGKSFLSPEGGLYLSVLLRPNCICETTSALTLLLAVAAADCVEKLCHVRPRFKWPNDLVLNGKKLAGILTELVWDGNEYFIVAGIGMNCSGTEQLPEEIQTIAASLSLDEFGREKLAREIGESFVDCARIPEQDFAQWLSRYRKDCLNLGKAVVIHGASGDYPAICRDIDDRGRLIVEKDGCCITVSAGEVSVKGLYGA